jgi:hypothetical protein
MEPVTAFGALALHPGLLDLQIAGRKEVPRPLQIPPSWPMRPHRLT